MRTRKAMRLRFGILAARYRLQQERLTPDQIDYLDDCYGNGWIVGDAWTIKAHDREWAASKERWLQWRQ